MRKGNDIIGKRIVAFDTGESLKRVEDLIFNQSSDRLLGFLVSSGGLFSPTVVLPLEGVQAIGRDAVIAKSKLAIIKARQIPEIEQIVHQDRTLKGIQIMTTDGRDLGKLVDVYFNELTGVVEGYEASGGIFADAYSGRSFIPAIQALKIGEQVAFVPPETTQLMDSQVGGIKAVIQNAQTANNDSENRLANYSVEQAEGRRVQRTVKAETGLIIAAAGQIVTLPVLEKARTYDKEQELLAAVGLMSSESRETGFDTTSDRLQSGLNQAKVEAKTSWERLKAEVTDFRQRKAKERENKRIKEALGRPVNRVILDQQDNVILNIGELVTHQAIDRARYADMLDILLDSVDERSPELTDEEWVAPVAGEASLEEHDKLTVNR